MHYFQNEARKLNHVEVIEESKRNKRPSNWEARKRKVEWEAAEEVARKVILKTHSLTSDGSDYLQQWPFTFYDWLAVHLPKLITDCQNVLLCRLLLTPLALDLTESYL